MEIRDATATDFEALRRTAGASMHESYGSFLDPTRIDDALEQWYGADVLAAQIDGEDALVAVAVEDDAVVGFVQAEVVPGDRPDGRILWLHVHPDARGDGLGSRLLAHATDELLDRGAKRITGVVLDGNDLGTAFYEDHGFTRAGTRTVEIGDEAHEEAVYVSGDDGTDWEALDEYDADGVSVYVNYAEADRGSKGRFYQAYADADRDRKYGFFCGACQGFDVSMNSMGVVECNDCENRRKATRWDASYL